MIDFSAMYADAYAVIGVPATMSAGTAGEITLTVIDETRKKTVASANGGTNVEISGVGPAACVRIPELVEKGIARNEWTGATLTFNGRSWLVRKPEVLGSPNGEDLGEVRFLLKAIESSDG